MALTACFLSMNLILLLDRLRQCPGHAKEDEVPYASQKITVRELPDSTKAVWE